jgi:hypothetical protein
MKIKKCHELAVLHVILICIMALSGCSSMGGQGGAPPPNPVGQQQQTTASTGDTAVTPLPSAPRPLFYDFPDIPVPQEVDLQSKESYVVQSGSIRTGLLTLRGRVDLNSLISFFQMAMPRENWKPKGYFRYQRSILIFEKPDKICVIRFYEGMVYSYVEIFVTPASG